MTFVKFPVILATVFVFLAVGMLTAKATQYAILVGVSGYVDGNDLPSPPNDAEALRDVLLHIGYLPENVYCLTSGSKTPTLPGKNIIEFTIDTVLSKAKPGDTVIIFLAGHGTVIKGESRFCPFDMISDSLDARVATSVSINDIMNDFRNCKATYKLMIVVACRPAEKLPPGVQPMKPLISPAEGVALIQSCSDGETSLELGMLQHGIFTYSLLEGFREAKDKDGEVTLAGLVAYTTKRTQELGSISVPAYHHRLPMCSVACCRVDHSPAISPFSSHNLSTTRARSPKRHSRQ